MADRAKVLTKFNPSNSQIVVSVGKHSLWFKNIHAVDISDRKDNRTRWLLNFTIDQDGDGDAPDTFLFTMSRTQMITEIQRKVCVDQISDLLGWDETKIILVNQGQMQLLIFI